MADQYGLTEISIHAPRGGSDADFPAYVLTPLQISIHAPRGGSDNDVIPGLIDDLDFNPRSPRGERPQL